MKIARLCLHTPTFCISIKNHFKCTRAEFKAILKEYEIVLNECKYYKFDGENNTSYLLPREVLRNSFISYYIEDPEDEK